MKFGIATRLGLLLAAICILAAGLTGFYAYDVSRDLLIKSARNELLTSTRVVARRVVLAREEISRNLLFVSMHPAAIAALEGAGATPENQIATAFELIMRVNPAYFQMRLISASENGLERVRVDRDGDNLIRIHGDDLQEKGHYPYVSDTLTLPPGRTYLSRFVINHERGAHTGLDQPTAQLATPVINAVGKPLGVVVINVDLKGMFDLLRADLPKDFGLYLANTKGDYLIHPDPTQAFGFDKGRRVLVQDEFPATQNLIDNKEDTVMLEARDRDHADAPVVATFIGSKVRVTSDESRIILGLAQPLGAVLEQADKLGVSILQIVGAFCVLGMVLAAVVARAVTRPINAMSQAVQNFADDPHIQDLPITRHDEIGQLALSFQQMKAQIQQQLSQLQASRQQMEHLAGHDVLTGLPNRRLFQDRLDHALARAKRSGERFALLFIDVDKFKGINDRWGHEAGDTVLTLVARRLESATRKADSVARMGGDEFVILLDNPAHRDQIVTIAEKLLENLRSPMQIGGHEMQVGFSLGISQYPENGTAAMALMASADRAMYEAKAAGRSGYRFDTPSPSKPVPL